MATKPVDETKVINITAMPTETIRLSIVGETPLIFNRLAEKAQQQLLIPSPKKNARDREETLKHEPMREFRDSPYYDHEDDAETYLVAKSAWFKEAMMTAAVRIPGVFKTEITQLVRVPSVYTAIYGIPEVFTTYARSADRNRTPDMRTRCIVPEWAAVVTIRYTLPFLHQGSIVNLLNAAGQVSGVGDWRVEKGGEYGSFVVTDPAEDERFQQIINDGGRAVQIAAMAEPKPFDRETKELLAYYDEQLEARGKKAA